MCARPPGLPRRRRQKLVAAADRQKMEVYRCPAPEPKTAKWGILLCPFRSGENYCAVDSNTNMSGSQPHAAEASPTLRTSNEWNEIHGNLRRSQTLIRRLRLASFIGASTLLTLLAPPRYRPPPTTPQSRERCGGSDKRSPLPFLIALTARDNQQPRIRINRLKDRLDLDRPSSEARRPVLKPAESRARSRRPGRSSAELSSSARTLRPRVASRSTLRTGS